MDCASVVLPVPRSPASVTTHGGTRRAPSASPHAAISWSVNSAAGMRAPRLAPRAVHLRADVEQFVAQPRRALEVEVLRGLAHLLLEPRDQPGEVVRPVVR